MTSWPAGFGAQVTGAAALDPDDSILGNIDGGKANIATKALRGCTYTAASTGAAYTATRTTFNEDFYLTVNANTTITLAGGGVTGEISVWNIVFVQDATGGRTVTVSGVEWFDGPPTFTTTANTANSCMFMQHGTGTIFGYYGGAATATTTYASDLFTRANSTTTLGSAETGGAWTAHVGTWGIINNACYLPAGSNNAHNSATLAIAQANVSVSVDVGLSSTLNRGAAGLVLRYTDANNRLTAYLFKTTAIPNNIRLSQMVAGVETTLGEVTSAGLVNGQIYALKAVISGTTVQVLVDGVEKIAATAFNAGLTTQKYGVTMYKASSDYDNAVSYFDNFLVTT